MIEKPKSNKSSMFRLLILALAFFGLLLIFLLLNARPDPNLNSLAIGELAKANDLEIVIRPPVELDFKTKAEVLQLRRDAVYWYPSLLSSDYIPSESIFGQIIDGLPWWGLYGQFYYGSGEQSIHGPAEEARFILNPYLLIAAEPRSFWDRNQFAEDVILRPDFPIYCEPRKLSWKPASRQAEVFYDAQCVTTMDYRYFDLISYNARDMNLNYIYVSYNTSQNVTKNNPPDYAYAIPHYIHQGGSCGYPGGCNNMSPPTPEIDALQLLGLPAQIEIWLWNQEPTSIRSTPDFVYSIHFQ